MRLSQALSSLFLVAVNAFMIGCCLVQAQEPLWSEEFDELDTNIWEYNEGAGGWGNQELQEYTRENVRVKDGALIITAQEETDGTITSGRIYTKIDFQFLYGRIEASIKLPVMEDGLHPAFWMLGSSFETVGWPASGTMTIMQAGSVDRQVGSSVTWQADNGQTVSDSNEISTLFDLTSNFLTFQMDWTPNSITTSVEGSQIFSQDISSCDCKELHQPFFFILNMAVGGTYTDIYERSGVSAPLPAEMVVDFIRVYNNSYTTLPRGMSPTYNNPFTQMPTFAPTEAAQMPSFAPTDEAASSLAPVGQVPSPRPSTFAPVMPSTAFQTIVPTQFPVVATSSPVIMTPAPIMMTAAPFTPAPTTPFPVATSEPTQWPTLFPIATFAPTPFPTWSPTEEPTFFPVATPEPTPEPTLTSKTSMPTDKPTWLLTDSPSPRPSRAPTTPEPSTPEPSASATRSPISEPTVEPTSNIPTGEPSASPSVSPTIFPTMAPTVAPLQRLTATGNTMTLQNVKPLDSVRTLKWQKVTRDHLAAEMPDILDGAELVNLSVTLTAQNPPYTVTRRHLFRDQERSLQTTIQEITFDTMVSIKSAKNEYDVNSFVDSAFETEAQKKAYLEELQNSDAGFSNAAQMSMTQGPSASQIQTPAEVDNGGVDTSGTPFIVGVSLAGAAVVGLIGLFIYSRRRRGKLSPATTTAVETSSVNVRKSHPFGAVQEADHDSLYDFNVEVSRRSSRDGASVFTSNSSVTMEYDDQVAFQRESMYASAELGAPTGGVTDSYKGDAFAHCYRYTVEAPSGLLGMVVESSVEGTPSVYGIKSTSPLASDVKVGDWLIMVDGLDVSEMDATAVSRLIATKKNNKYRQLVFVRPADDEQDPDIDVD